VQIFEAYHEGGEAHHPTQDVVEVNNCTGTEVVLGKKLKIRTLIFLGLGFRAAEVPVNANSGAQPITDVLQRPPERDLNDLTMGLIAVADTGPAAQHSVYTINVHMPRPPYSHCDTAPRP
jgi:hypothetical protein